MPLQDISANRNRGWSLDTSGSADDLVVFSGSGKRHPHRQPLNAPDSERYQLDKGFTRFLGSEDGSVALSNSRKGQPQRQPLNAPDNERHQADEGFARFLKKHASPTHQRVTAGGRIVPMEQKAAPPQFNLPRKTAATDSCNDDPRKAVGSGIGSVQRLGLKDPTDHNERSFGLTTRSLNPNITLSCNEDRRMPTEPFPKFYDGQGGHDNNDDSHQSREYSDLVRNAEHKCNTATPSSRTLTNAQGTTTSVTFRSLKKQPVSGDQAITATQALPKAEFAMLGYAPINPAYSRSLMSAYSQVPGQQLAACQQYLPKQIPSATESATIGYATVSDNDSRGGNLRMLSPGFATYPDQETMAGQVIYPSIPTYAAAGSQVVSPTSMPFYDGQIGVLPQGYYATSLFNTAGPSLVGTQYPVLAPGSTEHLQRELFSAQAQFQTSTGRLNTLDQFLATNREKLDHQTRAAHAAQRMAYVEQRANAKSTMDHFRMALESSVSTTPYTLQDKSQASVSTVIVENSRPTNKLNVEAPTWVPKNCSDSTTNKKVIQIRMPTERDKKAMAETSMNTERAAARIARIPVLSADHSTMKESDIVASPECPQVDEWGARIGRPPPELERQQSAMLESLTNVRSNTDKSPSPPAGSTGNASDPDGSWDSENPGRAPPEIEAEYVLYLDAMRHEIGTTTMVTLTRGQTVEVPGQGLKQPPWARMNDFEKEYWQRKPEKTTKVSMAPRTTDRMFDNLKRTSIQFNAKQTQEWVDGVHCGQKPVFSARAPWITDGTNLLNTKGESSVALQNIHVTSKTMGGLDGATDMLKGRSRTHF